MHDVIRSLHPFEEKSVGEAPAIGRPIDACPHKALLPMRRPRKALKGPASNTSPFRLQASPRYSRPARFNMLIGHMQVLVALSLVLVVRGAYLIDFSRVFHHNLANVKREENLIAKTKEFLESIDDRYPDLQT
ncbi:hypothetical protein JTE90_010523 [Oedothorax gibbosus]|uniref:Uncharacterized protein n=1 Tax=Oedothorax gibbosus TaxID=931172 RepID=A0AAV6VYR2_9ARAC|nr:hypothetical protein JTE90_010523 [Oedothorax gibbosus]